MSSAGGCPSRQKMVSVGTSIVPPGPCPPPADTPDASTAVTTPQVTASIHDFAVSLATPPTVRMKPVIQAAVRATIPEKLFDRAAGAAADALLEVWPEDEQRVWLAADLRSCAASLQQTAGDLLWADGCHPLLLRAGRSHDSA